MVFLPYLLWQNSPLSQMHFSPHLIVLLFIPPFTTLCVSDWELFWGLCESRMCLDQFCNIGAVSFLLKCMGRSTKRRSKVRLHFNKEPSLSSLMLCCHALQLQRNGTLITENWSKRHWAFPSHHSHLNSVQLWDLCAEFAVLEAGVLFWIRYQVFFLVVSHFWLIHSGLISPI